MKRIVFTKEKLESSQLRKDLPMSLGCGALLTFEGVVRQDQDEEKKIVAIEYECYAEMAEKEFGKILSETKEKWPVREIFIFHRVGKVMAGETSLVLFVFSSHRREAFEASQYIIDEMKKRVPIWKKEIASR